MRIVLTILLLPFSARAASLTGSLIDPVGASVANVLVELASETKSYKVQTDNAGIYQFADLQAGEYTLTITHQWFERLTVKSIELSEGEAKRIQEITITPYRCPFPPHRDFVRLVPSLSFGELSGTVLPPAPGVEVFLICRTFRTCGTTKTDSNGHFSFDMLSAGAYALRFHRDGFYDQDATEYEYYVNAGVQSVYTPVMLEACYKGSCAGKIQRILPTCE
jgi:hypothetical protein